MAFDLKKSVAKLGKGLAAAKKKLKKMGTLTFILGGFLLFVILFASVMAVGVYKYKWENNFTIAATKFLPFPAARVNNSFISYHEYLENLNMMKKYQVEFKKTDFKSEDGKKVLTSLRKDTLDRLVEDTLVKQQAKKLKVSLSNKELNDSFDDLVKTNGGEKAFAEVLKKYYDLSPEDFKDEIYRGRLLSQKVSVKFESDDSVNFDAKSKAQEVLDKVKAGEDFVELAKKYSQDSTAAKGGDLGLFGKGKMVPEFEQAAFALKAGQVSDLVKTDYGYHIIKVTEVKGEQIHAYHILIKTKSFSQWLSEAKTTAKIKKYIKE